ncbi:MAG: hypothetical protein ACJ76A_05760 [Actinomycetota bacterium]
MLTFTDRATDALSTFHAAAARWDPSARLRLVPHGAELRPEFTDAAVDGEVEVAVGSITVLVPAGVRGMVDAGEHNVLTVSAG